jgi:hypothetical protein
MFVPTPPGKPTPPPKPTPPGKSKRGSEEKAKTKAKAAANQMERYGDLDPDTPVKARDPVTGKIVDTTAGEHMEKLKKVAEEALEELEPDSEGEDMGPTELPVSHPTLPPGYAMA